LDPELNDAARVMVQELGWLERRMTSNGTVQIAAPEGKHDDMPMVLALGCAKAIWLDPLVKSPEENSFKDPSVFDRCMKTLKRQRGEPDEAYY
jgi:hypothetical protein